MSRDSDQLESARSRIRAAYSPEAFGELTHRLAALLTEHFSRIERGDGPVLNWRPPPECISQAAAWLSRDIPEENRPAGSGARDPVPLAERFAELVRAILAGGNNLHHPRYVGHQVPASIPVAALFDAVGSATNQVMAIYEMGPWATAVERVMIERVGEVLGLPHRNFAGLITNGGTLANLTGLLTARNVMLRESWERGVASTGPPPVLLVHSDIHYGITRAAGMLGIGTQNVQRVPLDARRRIDPEALDRQLQQLHEAARPVFAVAACACATPIGAFDPLPEIAQICRRHRVWLHVDAAHGGAAAFSARHRHLVQGLELADSIVFDAHKMLFMPALCAFVFYRNPAHRFETFRQDAPYLFDPSAPGMADYDSGMLTVECTKRAAAFGLWGVWALFGPQLFGDLVDCTFEVARRFHQMLCAAPDFEPLHVPECNIVTFRYSPDHLRDADRETVGEFNRAVRRRMIESGEFYLVQTNLDGAGALRATIINPLTTEADLSELLEAIRRAGCELAARNQATRQP